MARGPGPAAWSPAPWRQRLEPEQQQERDREADRVEAVDPARAGPGRDRATHRGPDDRARVARYGQQRRGRGQLIPGHRARDGRLQRRPLQRGQHAHRRGQRVQRPYRGMRCHCVAGQRRGQQAEPGLTPAEQPPPVQPVRQHPAVQAEHHQRDQFGHAEQADRERRPGELPGLHQQRHVGRLSAEQGDAAAGVQHPEAAAVTAAERGNVHPQQAAAHPACLPGRLPRTLTPSFPPGHRIFRRRTQLGGWCGGKPGRLPGRRPWAAATWRSRAMSSRRCSPVRPALICCSCSAATAWT
jgi:hypothetical protein